MKAKCLLAGIAAIGLVSCQKDARLSTVKTTQSLSSKLDSSFTTTPITASIIGKWTETKEHLQQQNKGSDKVMDTTYLSNSFDATDYFQFNQDSTAVLSQGKIYSINGIGQALTGAYYPIISSMPYKFRTNGPLLTLTPTLMAPMPLNAITGPYFETITRLDADSLVLAGEFKLPDGTSATVIDTHFVRVK